MSSGLQEQAKRILGISSKYPDSLLPRSYLKELERHLTHYPFDDNFKLVKQAKKGYGVLTCLEEGCGDDIALTPLLGQRDGGKQAGIGSLSAYHLHIETHPTHKRSCLRRVGKEVTQAPETGARKSLAGRMDSRSTTDSMVGGSHLQLASRASPQHRPISERAVPTALTASTLPAKRHSDSGLTQPNLVDNDTATLPPAKRAKQEPQDLTVPKSPLAIKTNLMIEARPPMDVEDTREQLQDVVKKFSDIEARYDRLFRKKSKTKGDFTRLEHCKAELDELRRKKDELKTYIPSATSPKRPFGKSDSSMSLLGHPIQGTAAGVVLPAAGPSTSRLALPAPPVQPSAGSSFHQQPNSLVFNVQPPPNHAAYLHGPPPPFNGQPQIAGPSRLHAPQPQPPLVGMNGAIAGPSYLHPVPTVKSEPGNPFDTRAPAAYMRPVPAPVPVKVEPRRGSSPVASSSKVPPPPPRRRVDEFPFDPCKCALDDDSDDDNDMNMDYDNERLAEATADNMIQRIGVNIPPPVRDLYDEEGLFYGRGKDLYAGPRAKADDITKFLVLAGNSEHFDGNARVDIALQKLGLREQYDLLPGMAVPLMAHQAIGVAWMIEKEKSALKGGCLADDMGLGKTVQMIATIIMNRSTDPHLKTTLVLAPLALLDQWKMEIEMKANIDLKVLIYHGPNRVRSRSHLLEYDIVLTTYSTMAMEWPDYEKEAKAKAKRQRNNDFIVGDPDDDYEVKVKRRKQESGLLFQVEFYRIVLDEAQGIRNRRTRASRAANELRATYRWCLTGTPIINGLTDCYGYLRFLKIRPWYDWDYFKERISGKEKNNPTLAVTRLQAVIVTYQIRRTKESKLDGKRLIELPQKDINLTELEFTTEEREIYTMVEARTQSIFNRFLRAGTVLKNYHQVLVLLLRLRQICSHPCLIHEQVEAFVPHDEVDNSRPEIVTELSRARNLISPEFVVEMKQFFKKRILERMEAEKKSADAALEDEDCPICLDVMDDKAVFTACKHVFCKECITGFLDTPITGQDHENKEEHPCPKCRTPITKKLIFSRAAFEPTEEDLRPATEHDSGDEDDTTNHKGKGKARASRSTRRDVDYYEDDSDDDMSDFIMESDEEEEEKDARRALKRRFGKRRKNVIIDSDDEMDTLEEQEVLIGRKTREQLAREAIEKMPRFLPSTKMKYMMQIIMKNFEKHPEEKILIVSQWTACLSLVSDYLTEKGIVHVKYQGDMNRDKRDQAVRVFMSKDKAKIMLMSLKCGGVGLNLTRANNVISLDLAWSRAVESQAWDRVHRLGQTRSVNVQRLVITNTVEDRILALQERKQTLADGSLGEGTGKKMGRLTVGELANLFGLDDRGNRL